MYACTVGCTVDVDAIVGDDGITEMTMISNMMDLMFLSRLMDMVSVSGNSISVSDDSSSEWNSEVDVYVPEVCSGVCVCVCSLKSFSLQKSIKPTTICEKSIIRWSRSPV